MYLNLVSRHICESVPKIVEQLSRWWDWQPFPALTAKHIFICCLGCHTFMADD